MKTIEELLKEKSELENKINDLINDFVLKNKEVSLIELQLTKMSLQDNFTFYQFFVYIKL